MLFRSKLANELMPLLDRTQERQTDRRLRPLDRLVPLLALALLLARALPLRPSVLDSSLLSVTRRLVVLERHAVLDDRAEDRLARVVRDRLALEEELAGAEC